MNLSVGKITDKEGLEEAFRIRTKVFVEEQGVSSEDEKDQFDATASHFLAKKDGRPVGTARWRFTDKGIKLERFAVLSEARGNGIGKVLVRAVLDDIGSHPEAHAKIKYLHAQLDAVSLYAHFGFEKVGEMFEECDILHFKMELA